MPKTSEMRTSKYLRKEDVGNGALLTVKAVTKENVAMESEPSDEKWCLCFRETTKPLVLNSTNIQLCEQIFDSDDTDDWTGKQIVAYTDPNISFGGKLIGGIRLRKPRVKTAPAPLKPATPPVAEPLPAEPADYDDGDINF
jgi:hypothetical protein